MVYLFGNVKQTVIQQVTTGFQNIGTVPAIWLIKLGFETEPVFFTGEVR